MLKIAEDQAGNAFWRILAHVLWPSESVVVFLGTYHLVPCTALLSRKEQGGA